MFTFEIHVSVKINNNDELMKFHNVCNRIGVKANTIVLSNFEVHHMTSSVIRSEDAKAAHARMNMIECALSPFLEVVRLKIEACPKYIRVTSSPFSYIEVHVPFSEYDFFEVRPDHHCWHFSKSVVKSYGMITRRVLDNPRDMLEDIMQYKMDRWVRADFTPHLEYAIYDNNPEMDYKWMGAQNECI